MYQFSSESFNESFDFFNMGSVYWFSSEVARFSATKIARKFYDAENVNKNRIDYINTFIRNHYDGIKNSIKVRMIN